MLIVLAGFGCKQAEPTAPVATPEQVSKQAEAERQKNIAVEEATKAAMVSDSDLDGLSNDEEKKAGTKSTEADTDADGLTDLDEVKTHKTDPLKEDTDGDGKLDGNEIRRGTNPLRK